MRVCFFVRIRDREIVDRNEFYAVDMRILKELGHELTLTTSAWWVPRAELYFVWWWTWAFFPLALAKLARRPVMIVGVFDHVMQDGTLEWYPARPKWHQWMIRQCLLRADANVVSSTDQQRYLQRHFSVRGLHYCPLVIDTKLYSPGSGHRENILLTFCWMQSGNSRRKAIREMIRAMARLHPTFPELRLLICGERGSDYPELHRLTAELGAQGYVEFPGVVSRERKIELMQRCAAYLQPTFGEGFGVAILEAMSCGAPVVTSPVGAVPEVAGDTVVMVTGSEPLDIARGVTELLTQPKLAADLGARARERAVRLYSYERRKSDLKRIISSLFQSSC